MEITRNEAGVATQILMTQPDDWHLHVRDGGALLSVIGYSATQFGRALVMPNLRPPVTTVRQALVYRERIMQALPVGSLFEPLMSLYLTDQTSPEEILFATRTAGIYACKLYPLGATTNSQDGVSDIRKVYSVLEVMQEVGMVLCVHGEVTDPTVDVFDREARFLDEVFFPLRRQFPLLKIVLEHITTADAAAYMLLGDDKYTAATVTPQHLLYSRNAIFTGGLQPHWYCLPVLKTEKDRQALIEAVTSGHPRIFLGTDSAPHGSQFKEMVGGHAGCFSAPAALEFYTEVFDAANALDKLEAFASHNGADFYGLPHNTGTITLVKEAWKIPEVVPFGDFQVKPLRGGQTIPWKFVG